MFFPSSKVIIRHPSDINKILLVRRNVGGAIYYEPAGGKVEVDFEKRIAESLEECAIREAQEELGVTVELEKYVGSYYFFWIIAPNKCSSCAVFIGKILNEDLTFHGNKDACELAIEPVWVTIGEVLEKKIPIDPSYVGLENLLMNCCRKIKATNNL
jgi:8-oxo-dGTP pyrophosphatase MutT (NUDIX family)